MESIFIDYFHDEAADTIEMSAFQAQHNQFNTMTHLFNYESALQNKTDFEQDSYWPAYFKKARRAVDISRIKQS